MRLRAPRIVRRAVGPLPDADLHPILKRVYAAREVRSGEELDVRLQRLLEPGSLGGLPLAVRRLERALRGDERVLIVGDYDADGATSTALMVRALRAMGARQVDYLVPNRFDFGYGLTPEIVDVAARRKPGLIVTVDNGTASLDGVARARDHGIDVLITDHHLPGPRLPEAVAIVNPNLDGDRFPSKCLAGVGVAFYVLSALRAHLRAGDWFRDRPEPGLARFLDLVALGTVADVVPLDLNNRRLVEQGLRRIRARACSAGITALLALGGRTEPVTAADLAFAVAPRLNAAGRLQDMSLGIACLLSDDPREAQELAGRLDQLNRQRREIEADMQAQALAALEALDGELAGELPPALCLYGADWHQGVIGILAARIRERVNRPVIAFAEDGEGMLKGSARSIPGVHVRDAIERVATRNPGLVTRFGGHAAAAGLGLARARLDAFRSAFQDQVGDMLDGASPEHTLLTDGEIPAAQIDLQLAELLRRAGPWGQGFPEPLFEGRFEVVSRRIVGEHHLKLVVRPPGSRRVLDAIAFRYAGELPAAEAVRLVYRLEVNEYGGLRRVQLAVVHLQADPVA